MTGSTNFKDQPRIKTAEQAIDRAADFLGNHGYYFKRPMSAQREGDQWTVLYDVSLVGPNQIVDLTIDSQTGDVTGFVNRSLNDD